MTEQKAVILDEDTLKALGMTKDGLENLIASLGTGNDKRAYSTFVNKKRLSMQGMEQELNAMYRTDWLSGKIVDIVPNDMTREWRTFISDDLSPEDREKLEKEEERLALQAAFNEAHKWGRLYGGGFILLAVDDGKDPKEPLIIDEIKEGQLKHITVLDRHRLTRGTQIQTNPLKPNFGFPVSYRLNETDVEIHHTRVIRFDGIKLPYDEFRHNGYWSDSVLDRLYDSITNFNTATNSSASMVYEAIVDIVKIKNFMGYLETDEGEKLLRKRISMANTMKSFNNTLILDGEEDYTSKSNAFSGLPDLVRTFGQIMSGASDIPATRLFGDSPKGLNSTGEGELKNYYDKIRADQNNIYGPMLNQFDIIMARNIGIDNPELLNYEFNSLFQMTDAEKADLENKNALRDQTYIDLDVVKRSVVAKQLKDDGTYSNISDEDISELEEEEENVGFSNAFTTPEEREKEQQEEEGAGSEDPEVAGSQVPSGSDES